VLRYGLCAIALLALLSPAAAEDGCGKFAWPLARERALFAAPDKPVLRAGDSVGGIPKTAFVLHLQPAAQASFALPPERRPKAERWSGGMLRFSAPDKAGIYQVTSSEEAWIDVVQDGRYARSVGSSGRSDCPGLRKSVRFELTAAPFVVQISGMTSESVVIAIGPRE
jgi:hypothetical protein